MNVLIMNVLMVITIMFLGVSSLMGENLLFNSSFELGDKGYSCSVKIPYGDKCNNNAISSMSVDTTTAAVGHASLRFELYKTNVVRFNSHQIILKNKKQYFFSFYAKASEGSVKINLGFLSNLGGWRSTNRIHCVIPGNGKWKRYHFKININHFPLHEYEKFYFLDMIIQTSGTKAAFNIDGLQMEENEFTDYIPSAPIETAIYPSSHIITAPFVKATLRTISYNKDLSDYPVVVTLEDEFFRKFIAKQKFILNLKKGISEKKNISFDIKRYGSFRILVKNKLPDYCSAGYLVRISNINYNYGKGFQLGVLGCVESLQWTDKKDYTKGLIWYNTYGTLSEKVKLTKQMGATFALSYGAGIGSPFYLPILEPEKDEFNWTLSDNWISELEKNNLVPVVTMLLQGSLAYTRKASPPKWICETDRLHNPQGTHFSCAWPPIKVILPPSDIVAGILKAIMKRYKNRIKAYETFCEPNGYFPPKYCVEYIKTVYETAKKYSPESKVVGMLGTSDFGSDARGYMESCLKLGVGNYCDAISFHPYMARQDDSPISAMKQIRYIKKIEEKYNIIKPLWNTEVFYLLPTRQPHYTLENRFSADAVARRILIDMGEGISKSSPLALQHYLHTPIRPDQAQISLFFGGKIPSARFAVFNAAARFVLGAKVLASVDLPGDIQSYVFKSRTGEIYTTIWSIYDKSTLKMCIPKSISATVYDLFGNIISSYSEELQLSLDRNPLYIKWNKATDAKQIVNVLKSAKTEKEIEFDISTPKLVVNKEGHLCVGLIIKNKTHKKIKGSIAITSIYFKNKFERVSYGEFLPYEKKAVMVPITLVDNAPLSFPIKIAISGSKRIFEFKRILKNVKKLEVNENKWTKDIKIVSPALKTVKEGDFAASFSLLYDNVGLRVKVKVTDDFRSASKPYTPWMGDCIEIFLDLSPLTGKMKYFNMYNDLSYQLVIPTDKTGTANVKCIHGDINKLGSIKDIKAKVTNFKGGYIAEISLPLKNAIGPLKNKSIGFTIAVNDNDKGVYKYNLTWTGKRNYKDRSGFALVYFK